MEKRQWPCERRTIAGMAWAQVDYEEVNGISHTAINQVKNGNNDDLQRALASHGGPPERGFSRKFGVRRTTPYVGQLHA